MDKKRKKETKKEIRFPKKIQILNRTFEIIRGTKYLGYFRFRDEENAGKPTIYITSRPTEALEAFVHETLEIALELARVRYERPDNVDEFVFYYSHKEHDIVAKIMAQVLQQVIDLNKK